MLKTLLLLTRALFRVFSLGVSVSMFGLCVKWTETVLQLVVLVAVIVIDPGCVRLVRVVILVIEFSRAWIILRISIGCVHLSVAISMAIRTGRYCYH